MDFEAIKKEVLLIARDDKACVPGYRDALRAGDFVQMTEVWKKYWSDVVGDMHFARTIQFLERNYSKYRTFFRNAGLAYNEPAPRGLIIANDVSLSVDGGCPEIFTFGRSFVQVSDGVTVRAKDKGTTVILHDRSSCSVSGEAEVKAYDRSEVLANGAARVEAHQSSVVFAGGEAQINAIGWNIIRAGGNAIVTAPHQRRIFLLGNAQFRRSE